MGTPSKHKASIVLSHCWICQARFLGDGGTEPREDHHMIPRASGGVDGPTVTLCDSHHSKTHALATALKFSKPYFGILRGESTERSKKLLYLANLIHNADLATRNDPNKAATAVLILNARHKNMVDMLKKIYPQAKSREAILLLALEALYTKSFIPK